MLWKMSGRSATADFGNLGSLIGVVIVESKSKNTPFFICVGDVGSDEVVGVSKGGGAEVGRGGFEPSSGVMLPLGCAGAQKTSGTSGILPSASGARGDGARPCGCTGLGREGAGLEGTQARDMSTGGDAERTAMAQA